MSLAIVETHPIQYHAPLWRALQEHFQIPVHVIYGSDFSIAGYTDREFKTQFAWDVDLLGGYGSTFLSRLAQGGARDASKVSTKGLKAALNSIKPRVLLVLGYSPQFYARTCFLALQSGHPLLFRGETTDHARVRGKLMSYGRDWALRFLYQRCRFLLYVGSQSLKHFRRLGVPDQRLISSPYCVDTACFQCSEEDRSQLRDATRRQLGIPSQSIGLLFCGKLSKRKGIDLLVAALKSFPEGQRRQFVLMLLGDGELRDQLIEGSQTEPRIDTRFIGFQNQTQLSGFYHAADLLVLPSRFSETWGLVVNEALHHGIPCVGSDAVGCAPDLIVPGETGELFESESMPDLASAIQRAVLLVGRKEIRCLCRQHVGGFSVHHAAAGIATAYRSVIQNLESPSPRS